MSTSMNSTLALSAHSRTNTSSHPASLNLPSTRSPSLSLVRALAQLSLSLSHALPHSSFCTLSRTHLRTHAPANLTFSPPQPSSHVLCLTLASTCSRLLSFAHTPSHTPFQTLPYTHSSLCTLSQTLLSTRSLPLPPFLPSTLPASPFLPPPLSLPPSLPLPSSLFLPLPLPPSPSLTLPPCTFFPSLFFT
mmetsp:Transcript_30155/g.62127  ORF Transcript_30155/g.62127 Transcript_30155/m.62127 type:complete len:191 (-) Transcript_30155:97-669(-)